jgi:hypothetical protein
MMKKLFLLIILALMISAKALAEDCNVSIYLFYASWNANSQKAQNITTNVANTYKKNVGYKALDVDSEDTYRFIKSNKLNMPKYLPSVMVVDKHKKVISTTEYHNQDELKLKNLLDVTILPNI